MNLTLNRDEPGIDYQEGILSDCDGHQWYTMERPWLGDKPGVSCIPAGLYMLVPHTIMHGPLAGLQTYALSNPELGVFPEPPASYSGSNPVRVSILIHPANWAFQLLGCIAPGKARGLLAPPGSQSPEPAVLSSREAFDEVLAALGGINQSGNSILIQLRGLP